MNDAKTELLLITKQQTAQATIDSITIGRSIIALQSPVRNMGGWLDSSKLCIILLLIICTILVG